MEEKGKGLPHTPVLSHNFQHKCNFSLLLLPCLLLFIVCTSFASIGSLPALLSASASCFTSGHFPDISFSHSHTRVHFTSSSTGQGPKRLHVFDLEDFGAVGDGKTDNTRAFQNAVYAVALVGEKGGGQLYVPPGKYLTGSFNLTSSMTLYLAHGAVIIANPDLSLWPIIPALPSYGRGRELPGPRYSSFIHGQNLTDIVITGDNGTVVGNADTWIERLQNSSLLYTRPSLVEFLWSKNIIINNVTLLDSPYWTIHPTYCRDVTMSYVTISMPENALTSDGIVPDSSENVLVEKSLIRSGGDGVVVKSGWDEYGIAYGMGSKNVVVQNVHITSFFGSGFAVGSEMSGGVEDIVVRDVTISSTDTGVCLKTLTGRGGFIRNITVHNVTMDNVSVAISFDPNYGEHPDLHYNPDALPEVTGIMIQDMVGKEISTAGQLSGIQKKPFQSIHLDNVNLEVVPGGGGFVCEYVNGTAKHVVPVPCPELVTVADGDVLAVAAVASTDTLMSDGMSQDLTGKLTGAEEAVQGHLVGRGGRGGVEFIQSQGSFQDGGEVGQGRKCAGCFLRGRASGISGGFEE